MEDIISLNVLMLICFCISQSLKGLVDKKLRLGCYLYFEGQSTFFFFYNIQIMIKAG